MTTYDVNGRGRAKKESPAVGRGAVRCISKIGSRTKAENLIPNFLVDQIVNDVLAMVCNGLHQTEKYLYSISSKQSIEEPKTGNSGFEKPHYSVY